MTTVAPDTWRAFGRACDCAVRGSFAAMATVKDVLALFDKFKALFESGDLEKCKEHLGKLKVAMLGFTSLPPATTPSMTEGLTQTQQQELLLAREILEHGALLSVKLMEIPAFERYVAQVGAKAAAPHHRLLFFSCSRETPSVAR